MARKTYTEDEARELALLCSFIVSWNEYPGSVLTAFDDIHKIAKQFMDKYPSEFGWQDNSIDFESALYQHMKSYYE